MVLVTSTALVVLMEDTQVVWHITVSSTKKKRERKRYRSTEENHLNQTEVSEKSFPGWGPSRRQFVAVVTINMNRFKGVESGNSKERW